MYMHKMIAWSNSMQLADLYKSLVKVVWLPEEQNIRSHFKLSVAHSEDCSFKSMEIPWSNGFLWVLTFGWICAYLFLLMGFSPSGAPASSMLVISYLFLCVKIFSWAFLLFIIVVAFFIRTLFSGFLLGFIDFYSSLSSVSPSIWVASFFSHSISDHPGDTMWSGT